MKSQVRTVLGESPIWNAASNSWYYVDIIEGNVFQLAESGTKKISVNESFVSNLTLCKKGILKTICSDVVIARDDNAVNFARINQPLTHRANDGSVGPDGKYWFGTMEKSPTGLNGKLYSLDTQGNIVEQGSNIGIPNSFIWLDHRFVLISDSYLKKTFKVELLDDGNLDWTNRKVWLDFTGTSGTPDGGALDAIGTVWLAVWGDASIHQYSQEGNLLSKIELNALQPTSCAFGGPNMDELLITTATEGMTDEQLKMYPDSGKVILKKMDVKGNIVPVFEIEV